MKTLYIYPTDRRKQYELWKKGQEPATFLYGYAEDKINGKNVFFSDPNPMLKKIIKIIFLPVEMAFYKTIGISVHFDHVFGQIIDVFRADKIISTSDSCSIPLLILKQLYLLRKKKIICMSIDLINRFPLKPVGIYSIIKNLYSEADRIIVFSREEEKMFQDKLGLNNVFFQQFKIDENFFKNNPYKKENKEYILTIGRDESRDYDFFYQIANSLPQKKFVQICDEKNVNGKRIPENVRVIVGASYQEILKWHAKNYLFLLPLRELHRASGQAAFLEAMASGLPIICSPVHSIIDNYVYGEKEKAFFLENDIFKWKKKILDI